MFSYKPGGFLPGKPVQPVLIKYKVSIYLNMYLNFGPTLKNKNLSWLKVCMSCDLFNERSWTIDYKSKVEIYLYFTQIKK